MGVGAASAVVGLINLGIVTALPGEARLLTRRKCAPLSSHRLVDNVQLQLSGMGPVAAERAAQTLVNSGCGALVSWGCAGALAPHVTAGTLLLPGQVVNAEGQCYFTDPEWRERLAKSLQQDYEEAALLSTDQPVASVEAKARWYTSTQAVAVDMESAAVAAVAKDNGLPFLVIRAVADTAGSEVPVAALQALSDDGELQPLAILTALAKHPGQIPALIKLGRCFSAAQASLAHVAERGGPRLGAA